jgi:hypothetical protein
MYSGYKLKLKEAPSTYSSMKKIYTSIGKEMAKANGERFSELLEEYLLNDNSLDASKLQRNIFPDVDADVFLSHSSKDIDEVYAFAGYLNKRFGLSCFIDSTVWGNVYDLLKTIDGEYCRVPGKIDTFYYEDCIKTASHVYMMLATALMTLIDNTECLMLLDSPESLQYDFGHNTYYDDQEIVESTTSAWIFAEIAFSRCVWKPKESHERRQKEGMRKALESTNFSGGITMRHRIDTLHLNPLTKQDIILWRKSRKEEIDPLDTLYDISRPKVLESHVIYS